MDDDEDFEALFFAECDENLADLQGRLDALLAGDGDPETVNAAFRAVHSVKGGAASFGFQDLVSFAHGFETVMDRVRSGALALGPELCETLLRSSDVMVALVDAARSRTEGPSERAAQVMAQLAEVGKPPPPQAAPVAAASVPEVDEPSSLVPCLVSVRIVPGHDFLVAGFDPLRMIRAARAHGLVSVKVEGEVPPIGDLTLGACPLAWRLEFESDGSREALDAFLATYAYAAEVVIAGGARAPSPERAAPVEPATQAPEAPAHPVVGTKASVREAARAAARSLRVDLDRVDRLVNLVGEVLIAQAALTQTIGEAETSGRSTIDLMVEALTRQTRELQESVMAIRAQPVRTIFSRMPRLVRELADLLGKEARLVTLGEDVEVDTTVIEELNEPLVHMIRNAMDHGLEPADERLAAGKDKVGTLTLAAEQRGGRVLITLSDDGRGINRSAVQAKARARGLVAADEHLEDAAIDALVFQPGFSTASEVSQVSGRGVGMDVVRRNIQAIGGRCSIASWPGRGTTITITLPLTLAVMDGMTVRVSGQQYILPVSTVVEAIAVQPNSVTELPDRSRILKRRGTFLPLLSLREALSLPVGAPDDGTAVIVDTETGGPVAVLVDDLVGQRQVVLKSLDANVGRIEGVSGATILGDGQVALVLDVPALFRLGPRVASADLERVH